MISKILDVFSGLHYDTVFLTREAAHILSEDHAAVIADARSAMFMAYGAQRMKRKGSILIVCEDEISHCYTGLTEAWFQNEPVVLIELSSRKNSYPFLERCTKGQYFMNDDNYRAIITDAMKDCIKPIVFSYISELNIKTEQEIPDKVLNDLLSGSFPEIVIAGFKRKDQENVRFWRDLYGALSKYFGYVQTNDRKVLLVAPSEILDYERNIFYTRYLKERVKIILFGKIRPELESLLRGCGISFYRTGLQDALQKATEESGAVICVVSEEMLCTHH